MTQGIGDYGECTPAGGAHYHLSHFPKAYTFHTAPGGAILHDALADDFRMSKEISTFADEILRIGSCKQVPISPSPAGYHSKN